MWSTSSGMSSSANLRACSSSTPIRPQTTMSLEALPTPRRLRRVDRATRWTFSLAEVRTMSTSFAMSPTFELAISSAASGEYERLHSEKSVW